MEAGFKTRIAEVVTTDFRIFKLSRQPIEFQHPNGDLYRIPLGAPSDLASVPRVFQNVLPPTGEYALEAYLHDSAYQNTLEIYKDYNWVKAELTKLQCDDLFLTAMNLNPNISAEVRSVLYSAVSLAGQHAFDQDRQ